MTKSFGRKSAACLDESMILPIKLIRIFIADDIWRQVVPRALIYKIISCPYPVADPGFPVGGGVDLVRGAVDPQGGYISKILHVKTKRIWTRRGGGAPP